MQERENSIPKQRRAQNKKKEEATHTLAQIGARAVRCRFAHVPMVI